MRIALVSPYDLEVPGGVQAHVFALAAELQAAGDEVTLLGPGTPHERTPHDRISASGAGEDLENDTAGASDAAALSNAAALSDAVPRTVEQVRLGGSRAVPFNGSRAPLALAPWAVTRTRAALRDLDPDVVHVHEPLVPLVGLTAATAGVAPTVGTFHAWSHRDRIYRTARLPARRVLRGLAASIAVSPAAAGYHARALGVAERLFRIIPNGVEVARFATAQPFPEVVDDARPALLFVGRLEPRKGLEPMIRAFTRLKVSHPQARLYVVGDGPERHRGEALLAPRLAEDVVFLGRVPGEDLPRWYASCDVYVSPALGGESFGIVLLEAMAAGRAVVASDIPGYRSVATDGVQARLVPPGDPVALAETLGALLDNPSLRAALGDEGRQHAASYDWPVVADRVRQLYLEVAASR